MRVQHSPMRNAGYSKGPYLECQGTQIHILTLVSHIINLLPKSRCTSMQRRVSSCLVRGSEPTQPAILWRRVLGSWEPGLPV